MTTIKQKLAIGLIVVLVLGAIAFFAFAPGIAVKGMNRGQQANTIAVSPDIRKFHYQLRIADLHADSLLWHRNLLDRGTRGHVDLPRLQEGNVALQVFTTVTKSPDGLNNVQNDARTRDNITLLALAQRWPPSGVGSPQFFGLFLG